MDFSEWVAFNTCWIHSGSVQLERRVRLIYGVCLWKVSSIRHSDPVEYLNASPNLEERQGVGRP